MKTRVIIVDDHAEYRKVIRYRLEQASNVEVVGEASNGKDFLRKLESLKPNVAIIDLHMPLMDGAVAAKLALKERDDLKIIAMSMFGETDKINIMLNAGAKGFLLKP
ncbi:MAG: response regulator transcription factor, partial [Bacteroidales bacterium]|nr:response regulator transcription factor [Bacteroidales bacterium]